MLLKLQDLHSSVTTEELFQELVPPAEFTSVSFENYQPDPKHPSQQVARDLTSSFANGLGKRTGDSRGVYLDGGFGVGKTHLLASIYHQAKVRKLYGPFIAYTSMIGYLGFNQALSEFAKYRLICIDEFELDDPGDTMIMSRLLKELSAKGVCFAATSNTPPNALGQGRFASDAFQREISSVAARFEMLRIDGEDYRHRRADYSFVVTPDDELKKLEVTSQNLVLRASFGDLLDYLASIHQSRYAKLSEQFQVLVIDDLYQIQDQFEAVRFVSFIDRCYEAGIALRVSTSLEQIFREDHLLGAYQKKYRRCLSRLYAMNSKV
jgi:cell division protein ZapE